MTLVHPELVAATQRHVTATVSAYLDGRTIAIEPDADGLRYPGYVDLEVVASRDPADRKTIARDELGDLDYELGDTAAFELFLDDPIAAMHPWLVANLGRPRAGLRDAYVAGVRAAASELFGADAASWVGRWFMLAPGALARGEMIVHPPGALAPERAVLVATIDVGAVAFGQGPRTITHTDLSAMTSLFGGVGLEKNNVRIAIPVARLPELARPADDVFARRILADHPPFTGQDAAALRAAFAEIEDGEPGSAVRAALRLRARLHEGAFSFIERRLAIRLYVLVRRLLAVALDLDDASVGRLLA